MTVMGNQLMVKRFFNFNKRLRKGYSEIESKKTFIFEKEISFILFTKQAIGRKHVVVYYQKEAFGRTV